MGSARSSTRPWPLRPLDREGAAAVRVALDPSDTAPLSDLAAVRFERVEMPDGRRIDLDLTRVRPVTRDCVFAIDGGRAPMPPDEGLTMWTGKVEGDPDGHVFLAFSPAGSRGVIELRDRRYHIVAQRGADGAFDSGASRLEVALPEDDLMAPFQCGEMTIDQPFFRTLRGPPAKSAPPASGDGGTAESPPPTANSFNTLYDCTVGVETDYQLYQKFNNAQSLGNYVATLFGAISALYQQEIGVSLTVNYVGVWTTSNDPWVAQDGGGNANAVLNEFQSKWGGNKAPVVSKLHHFLSGANLGGGVAWLDVLCSPSYSFGVSGNLSGNLTTPVSQGGGTWDFVVAAHEMGHNFGTQHTHDYCPPLDQCAAASYFGSCQTQQVCGQGTIMSYCHTCSGGMNNIQITFGSTVAAVMRDAADNGCLPVVSSAPDLSAAILSGPAGATIGSVIDCSVRVNSVGAAYSGPYDFQIRLSSDAVITSADPAIYSGTGNALGAAFSVQATIPLLTALGSYHLGLTVDSVTNETNGANNSLDGGVISIHAGSGAPDLVAVDITGPASASPGDVVSLTRTIVNTGGALASAFDYEVRLTQNNVVTSNDVLVATVSSSQMGQLVMSGVTIPPSLAAGTWYYGILVPPVSGETDSSDNSYVGGSVAIASVPGIATAFDPGDDLSGAIANLSDVDGADFYAVQGEAVGFTLSQVANGLAVSFAVTPQGGSAVSLGAASLGVPLSYLVPSTGLYHFALTASAGSGNYTVATQGNFAGALTEFTQKLLAANGPTQHHMLPAIPGTLLDLTATASKKLKSKSLVPALFDPSHAALDISPYLTPVGKKGFALDAVYLDAAGTFDLSIGGVKGTGKPVTVTGSLVFPVGGALLTID